MFVAHPTICYRSSLALQSAGGELARRLCDLPITLGRCDDAEICLDDQYVSRYHCRFECFEGETWIRDLGSRHGTWVNGERVTFARLKCGDELIVGVTMFQIAEQWSSGHVLEPEAAAC